MFKIFHKKLLEILILINNKLEFNVGLNEACEQTAHVVIYWGGDHYFYHRAV
jgi:hypothetical protein